MSTQRLLDLIPDIPADDWPAVWAAIFNATFETAMAAPEMAAALKAQWSQIDIDELIVQLEEGEV